MFTEEAPGFEGIFYDKANPMITDLLKEKGALLKLDFFTHSYPHDWRTKKPVIYRATPQWFASIDKFRQNILDEVEKVEWVIPWGKTRLYNMIRDRGDWVISRQRAWGVPLPIFYAENGEAIITPETIEHVAKLFAEHGSIIWFEKKRKNFFLKDLPTQVLLMANLQKKKISWMSGLILVLLMKLFYVSDQNYHSQQICI